MKQETKQETKSILVKVSFDIKKSGLDPLSASCYGIAVKEDGGMLVGECSQEELQAFKDGGRV